MGSTGLKGSLLRSEPDAVDPPENAELALEDLIAWHVIQLRLLWENRRFLVHAIALGLVTSALVAFLIPKSYTSTTQLMPPDQQSASGLAMMASLAQKAGSGLGSLAGDLLGVQSSGALFVGVLRSETAQDRLVEQFDLRKIYGQRLESDARARLDQNTVVSEDRKSGIISISVTDHSPERAARLANGYVDELNSLVAALSTSSAHRERVFLEERLNTVKQDLDSASNQLAQFSSKNNTLDIQEEGKAMLDAAGTIAGELIAAQSELEGLRQIYTDSNPRVRSLSARVSELRNQLDKLGGTRSEDTNIAGSTRGQALVASSSGSVDMPFPTIKSLPLLGVKYADYYQHAKIEETVYELLTEQYELAKVEEAKETPSVRILDTARIPERKSYPPRLLFIFLGTILALSGSVVWILGSSKWNATAGADPRKMLAREVFQTLKSRANWLSRNGHGLKVE